MNLLITLLGCGPGPGEPLALAWRSESFAETHGLQLAYDGRTGHAGIRDTTCEIGTTAGGTGTEWDLPGPHDTVLDGWDDPDMGFTTVTRGSLGAWIACPGDADPEVTDHRDFDLEHARLVRGGFVAISDREGDCVAAWMGFDQTVQDIVALPARVCDRSTPITTDRQAAELIVATPSRVLRVARDGWEDLGVQADLVAWDPVADALYAARGDRLTTYDHDGRRRWSTRFDGRIVDLSDLGDRGAAVVIVAPEEGRGLLQILDGENGAVRLDTTTPEPARQLAASGNGEVLGLIRRSGVLFVDVLDEDQLP